MASKFFYLKPMVLKIAVTSGFFALITIVTTQNNYASDRDERGYQPYKESILTSSPATKWSGDNTGGNPSNNSTRDFLTKKFFAKENPDSRKTKDQSVLFPTNPKDAT